MIIGTQEFEHTFCDIKLTASNCSLTYSEIQRKETLLNQAIDELNLKYSKFAKLNSNFEIAKMFIPATALSCVLDQEVVNLINENPQTQRMEILGMTSTCNPYGFVQLFINLIVVYLVICGLFWFYDKKK